MKPSLSYFGFGLPVTMPSLDRLISDYPERYSQCLSLLDSIDSP